MKERLDKVMADLGIVSSRSQAKSLIEKGDVTVNGNVIIKASEAVDPSSDIQVTGDLYVGRGAFKLKKALEEFSVDVKDLVCLDVGASTGGFTEILLQHGAKKVYAIDVGRDQLAEKIKNDLRVVNMEGTNIKDVNALPDLADGAVMDLSFISITKVLSALEKLIRPHGFLLALIKPQFEAGLERLPKDGVVKDPKVREEILNEVVSFAEANHWRHHKTILSPIEGKAGNTEYLAYFTRN